MNFKTLTICFLLFVSFPGFAQLKVSADKKYLHTRDGKPFFWLGDTGWELFHRLNKQEADMYLQDRAQKGFTVIQAVVLAELDGLNTPNPYGDKPLINNDPTKPNEAYFKHVDYIVNKAQSLGLIIAMLPSWGDKWNKKWGVGPEIFTAENARSFGEYIGRRYKNKSIVWVMGGDRDLEEQQDYDIINAMAKGLKKGDGGAHLFTFHPQGGKSSSDFFKDAAWLDFHMSQTGHSSETQNFKYNAKHLAMTPARPHLDGEPRYEDHPNQFNPGKYGWMDDFDARQTAYWSMLSGAAGHTYGNHNIWQMYTEERKPISWARTHWKTALKHSGSMQVGLMRKMMEKRPWQRLVPDQTVITSDNPEGKEYVVASVSQEGDFLMAYLPYGKKVTINTQKLKAKNLRGWWFNPRDGRSLPISSFENTGNKEFSPHSEGRGSDWVLIIEDAAKNFPNPTVQ
ncbi:MAG TPA: glycoside hydrolase family 140 protein [Chitinophagaceae bacterium]|nr:glycoside hydrolase family 140 protein [Chitinophagaceae bacterium]